MALPGAPAIQVAEVVSQHFQIISGKVIVVPQDLIVARSACALDPLVTHKVEVSFCGVVDALVHHGACEGVAVPVLVGISWEEPTSKCNENSSMHNRLGA